MRSTSCQWTRTVWPRSPKEPLRETSPGGLTLPVLLPGLSDPFVQLCLEPNHVFQEVETRCTRTKSRDLNPLFEEAFEL